MTSNARQILKAEKEKTIIDQLAPGLKFYRVNDKSQGIYTIKRVLRRTGEAVVIAVFPDSERETATIMGIATLRHLFMMGLYKKLCV